MDHPSFGAAIISRVLEDEGFRVAVLSQWIGGCDRVILYGFGRPARPSVTAGGLLDSMVAHYTAKRKRSDDAYSRETGRKTGRQGLVGPHSRKWVSHPDTPVILGGLEASLRRFAHYDIDDRCAFYSAGSEG